MKLTKYEHASVVLEDAGQALIIDPGTLSPSIPIDQYTVVGIVITHVHTDHIDIKKIRELVHHNPGVKLYAPQEVSEQYTEIPFLSVSPGEQIQAGPFTLAFTGGEHAIISDTMPVFENIGVLVNRTLYYPGDSFDTADAPVDVLLAPAAGPWLKINEAINFIDETRAKIVIPTHDAVLSQEGKVIHDTHLQAATERAGGTYKRLEASESIEI